MDNSTRNLACLDYKTAARLGSGTIKEKAEIVLGRRITLTGGGSKPNPSYWEPAGY